MSAFCLPASRIHVAAAAWQCFNTVGSISFRSGSSKIKELLMTHLFAKPQQAVPKAAARPLNATFPQKKPQMKHIC